MKPIWNILKYFGIIAGSVGTLFGIFRYLDNISDDVADVKEMTEYNNMQINDVSNQIYDLQDTAEDIRDEQIKQGYRMDNLTWIVRNRNNYTQDQLEELMDMMMERSSVTAPSTIPTPVPTHRGEVVFIPLDTIQ